MCSVSLCGRALLGLSTSGAHNASLPNRLTNLSMPCQSMTADPLHLSYDVYRCLPSSLSCHSFIVIASRGCLCPPALLFVLCCCQAIARRPCCCALLSLSLSLQPPAAAFTVAAVNPHPPPLRCHRRTRPLLSFTWNTAACEVDPLHLQSTPPCEPLSTLWLCNTGGGHSSAAVLLGLCASTG